MDTSIKIKQKRNNNSKEKQESFMLSLFIHLLLLLFLLIPILNTVNKPPQPPQFQGIQVALGVPSAEERTNTQSAASAAAQPQSQPKAPPAASATKIKAQPKAKPTKSQKQHKAQPKAAPKKIVSKTISQEADLQATKEKKQREKAEEKRLVEMRKVEKAKAESEAKERAMQNAKKRVEQKAEAERQAKRAEQQRKAVEEQQRQAKAEQEAKARKQAAKSKFNQLLQNTNASGAASKGDPKGRPNASALEGMTTGKGHAGRGLGARGLIYSPVINDSSQKKGKVVVIICVNAQGKVSSANYTQKGSTTTDSHLIRLATENAMKYEFSASSQEEQCGEIVIDFKLR